MELELNMSSAEDLKKLGYKLKVEDLNGSLYYSANQKAYLKIDTYLNSLAKADSDDQFLEFTVEEIEFAKKYLLDIEE